MELQSLLSTLNGIAAIVVVLGLCLFCHELGHFMAAKAFRCTVYDFALGFGPTLFRRHHHGTDYRLNAIPFGGYVRIAGMEPGAEPVAGGFNSLPRYQGAVILLAGVFMNMVLAVAMFAIVSMWTGVTDPSDTSIRVGKVMADSPAERAGLRVDDKLVAIDGCRQSLVINAVTPGGVAETKGIKPGMAISTVAGSPVHLPTRLLALAWQNKGTELEIAFLDYTAEELTEQQMLVMMPMPPRLADADADAAVPALEKAWGVKFAPLDRSTLAGAITLRPNQQVPLTVVRAGKELELTIVPEAEWQRYPVRDRDGTVSAPHMQTGRIGIVMESARTKISFSQSIVVGAYGAVDAVRMVIFSLKLLITKQVEGGAGGPVAIMAMSVEQARIGWDAVLRWVGLISANLAVINLIPFPPFDGFHTLVIGVEGLIKQRLPEKAISSLMLGGFIVMALLFMLLTASDLMNLIRFGTP